MKSKIRKERGITLIALVVTIIVLLLLAGVSIMTLTGQNGILSRAKESARNTNRETLREELQLEIMDTYDENGFDMKKFKEKLKEKYEIEDDSIQDTEDGGFTFQLDGYTVKVGKEENGTPKVEIEGDGDLENLPTPPDLNDLENGDTVIKLSTYDWTKGPVTVTIDLNIDKGTNTLQYSKNDEKWTNYTQPFEVTENNTLIRARLWNGKKEGGYATAEVTKIDKVDPKEASIKETAKDGTSITVEASATDGDETGGSGVSGIKTFKFYYKLEDSAEYTYKDKKEITPQETGTTTFKYEGLEAGKTYKLKVEAYDQAENMKEAELGEGIKLGTAPTVSSVSASRDWTSSAGHSITLTVSATDNEGGTITYNVQYGTSSTNYNKTATGSGKSGSNATIKLTGLSEYTKYYYKVTATDSTNLSDTVGKTGDLKTYCIGGNYCSGKVAGTDYCKNCKGTGYNGKECGKTFTYTYMPWDISDGASVGEKCPRDGCNSKLSSKAFMACIGCPTHCPATTINALDAMDARDNFAYGYIQHSGFGCYHSSSCALAESKAAR